MHDNMAWAVPVGKPETSQASLTKLCGDVITPSRQLTAHNAKIPVGFSPTAVPKLSTHSKHVKFTKPVVKTFQKIVVKKLTFSRFILMVHILGTKCENFAT